MTTGIAGSATDTLVDNPVREELVAYLESLKAECGTLSREQVLVILGQWFHPLHYFPTFLSRLISVTPQIEEQTFISRILWQELGEGHPNAAHEKIYTSTIADNGFEQQQVTEAPPFETTRALVDGYRAAAQNYLTGLGFLYGTEVVDLPMVSAIGELMKRCTGKQNLPWVNVHVAQEPEHVDSSTATLRAPFTDTEQRRITESAEEMWRLWIDFFKGIRQEILH